MNPSIRRWRDNCFASSPEISRRLEVARLFTRERLKERLRDPEGTHYREVVATVGDHGVAICGEINLRNGFGGFVGYQKFLANSQSLLLPSDDDLASVRITTSWPEYCTGPSVRVIGPVKLD
jgi:hypothetical protein